MTRTGRVPKLMRHRDFFSVSMNPADALAMHLRDGELVEIYNELGRIRGLLRVEADLAPGQLFSPIHWSGQFSGAACVSELIAAVTDPVSGQPESKFARVSVAALATSCWGLLLTRQLPVLPRLAYWSRVVVPGGYLTFLAAEAGTPAAALYAQLQRSLACELSQRSTYEDATCGDFRELALQADGIGHALFLHNSRARLPSRDWLAGLLSAERPLEPTVLLAGIDRRGTDPGRLVCTCWEIGEKQIEQAISAGACTVDKLGAQLRCGTQCGSCVPELRRLLLASPAAQAGEPAAPLLAAL
jgi:assimilatory nitrate reductase catalytic subunit